MNESEIKEALEIIKKPITAHSETYKYFDEENYNKLISVYENCLWLVNLYEQIKDCIKPITDENEKINANINKAIEAIKIDLAFCEKVKKIETDSSKLKNINDLIEYDNNLLKILEGDKDGIMD